jgi:hypothetical protein
MNAFVESANNFVEMLPMLLHGQVSRVPAAELWSMYQAWASRSKQPVASKQALSSALKAAGAVRLKASRIIYDLTPVLG